MLKIREELFKPKQKTRTWKNVGLLSRTLQELLDREMIKPGGDIDTAVIAEILRDNGLHVNWDLSIEPDDEHGLVRSIGDTIGGHGLGLRKVGRSRHYIMPDGALPVVNGDTVVKEAVYITTKGATRSQSESVGRLAHTYVASIDYSHGLYAVRIRFDVDVVYKYSNSVNEQVLDVLNPVACDKDLKALPKATVREAIERSRASLTPVTLLLNPSIYQKLYGAHSPGKSIFQREVAAPV